MTCGLGCMATARIEALDGGMASTVRDGAVSHKIAMPGSVKLGARSERASERGCLDFTRTPIPVANGS